MSLITRKPVFRGVFVQVRSVYPGPAQIGLYSHLWIKKMFSGLKFRIEEKKKWAARLKGFAYKKKTFCHDTADIKRN